tara:strand:+ start:31 stop:570 length:540 start_codon:yes stop_codon:yes gene_type:complete
MARPSRSGKDQKKKRTDLFRRISNKLKIKKLQETNKRGRVTKKKTGLSNIPVQERSAPVNKKSRGLSNLGSDYKKQEEKLSKTATKKSARINKARYPEMGTYKGKRNTTTSTTKTNTPKAGSGRLSIREKNEARFGKPHVDKLRQKHKDFQAMKKKKMTKAEFIKKYPNSQTAKKARGL